MEMCFFIICNECPKSDQKGPLCGEPQQAEILRDDSSWKWEGFRLKKFWIRRTVSRKIACSIVGTYTSDPSGQFYFLHYESSTYLRGW